MPTILSNSQARGGTQGILSDRVKIDMRDEILLLEPSASPLTVFSKHMNNREQVNDTTFKCLKDELIPRLTRINSATGYTASVLTFKVDNDEYFVVGDMFAVARTNEVMRVSSISATDSTVTVTARSWGGTAAADLNNNDQLVILAHASSEASTKPALKSTKTTTDSNYIQVVRKPFGVTDFLDAVDLYGGDALTYLAKKSGIEHMKDIEYALWFGEKGQTTAATITQTTGGVNEWITTNEIDFSGGVTALEWENALRTVFRYGSGSKMAFVSRELLSLVNLLALGKVEQTRTDDTFGVSVKMYESPFGSVPLVGHPLFSDADHYKERGYILDMDQLGYRWLKGRIADDTHIVTNIQANDETQRQDEYRTWFGLFRGQEKTCLRMIGAVIS